MLAVMWCIMLPCLKLNIRPTFSASDLRDDWGERKRWQQLSWFTENAFQFPRRVSQVTHTPKRNGGGGRLQYHAKKAVHTNWGKTWWQDFKCEKRTANNDHNCEKLGVLNPRLNCIYAFIKLPMLCYMNYGFFYSTCNVSVPYLIFILWNARLNA